MILFMPKKDAGNGGALSSDVGLRVAEALSRARARREKDRGASDGRAQNFLTCFLTQRS